MNISKNNIKARAFIKMLNSLTYAEKSIALKGFNTLKQQEQSILSLRHLNGMSFKDISKVSVNQWESKKQNCTSYGISETRTQAVYCSAIFKLMHPSRRQFFPVSSENISY